MKNKKGFALSFLLVLFIFGVTIPLFMTNHKKVKADTITDLNNTTWTINDASDITTPSINETYYINFSDSNDNYTQFKIGKQDTKKAIFYDYDLVLYGGAWVDESYRTITINGGTDATNSNLISWLQNNAIQQIAPQGTQITHKYWSPYGVITMQNNQRIGDEDIQYTVLYNEYTDNYDETTQTGLIFTGVLTEQDPAWSYIESINGPGINILYHGTTNNINNAMWLEFTYGDYMDAELYDFMDLWGYWFDDDNAYIVGMNQGYAEGTIHGRALGQADGVEYTGLITGIFNGLGNLLSIQVFPNITIGLLIGLPLLLGALIIILKILRG